MKIVILAFSVVLETVTLSGCFKASPKPAYTVDYYRAHADAREHKLRECANNPGELQDTPDCINAQQAGGVEGIGSLRNLPPLQLPKPGERGADTKGAAPARP